jgi:hypothetical protein
VHSKLEIKKVIMASSSINNSEFLLEDDFDAILSLLEDDSEVDSTFLAAAETIVPSIEQFTCPRCAIKVYKSLSGLNRHIKSKHQDREGETENETGTFKLTEESLLENLVNVKLSCTENKCYHKNIRTEISTAVFSPLSITRLQQGIVSIGDVEKFFTTAFSSFVLEATSFFPSLSCDAATLLIKKLVDIAS